MELGSFKIERNQAPVSFKLCLEFVYIMKRLQVSCVKSKHTGRGRNNTLLSLLLSSMLIISTHTQCLAHLKENYDPLNICECVLWLLMVAPTELAYRFNFSVILQEHSANERNEELENMKYGENYERLRTQNIFLSINNLAVQLRSKSIWTSQH